MTTFIYHQIGNFNQNIAAKAQEIFNQCLEDGLKSKNQLIREGLVKEEPVKGIFSDEHDNIYFWPTVDFISNHSFFVGIEVNPEEVHVYNSRLRGEVDFFAYKASQLTLSEYLELHYKTFAIKQYISGLSSVLYVLQHRLTANPIYIPSHGLDPEIVDDLLREYSPEVIIPANIIVKNNFVIYGKKNEAGVLEAGQNEEAELFPFNISNLKRGVFLNDKGNEYYIPNADRIEGDFGKVLLHAGDSTFLSERYQCSSYHQHIDISQRSIPNYEVIKHANDDEIGRFKYIIKGDERNNTIKLLPDSASIVIPGSGADTIYVAESDWITTIIGFNASEGDKIGLPKELYTSSEEVISKLIYKNDLAIIPASNYGSLLIADIEGNIINSTDIFIY